MRVQVKSQVRVKLRVSKIASEIVSGSSAASVSKIANVSKLLCSGNHVN